VLECARRTCGARDDHVLLRELGRTSLLHCLTRRTLLQKVMTRSVSLHPSFFGKNFQQTLERKLKADCEGVWSETFGFIVLVADVTSFGKGKVQDETGHAVFTLKFNALVFRVRPWDILVVALTLATALSRRGAGRGGESD
jgi:hypothetical protein